VTASTGISGVAVSVATLGAVLIYAGFRGVSPIQALRDVAGGHPAPVVGTPTSITSSTTGGGGAGTGATTASGLRGAVVAGASANSGDTYSQARRTQPGYSDCSSFVDKALHSAGIKPPGATWANTTNFRLAGDWRTIPASQAQPGDIAVSVGHMVLVTGAGGSSAIGQERTGVNVRTGSVASLFGSGTKYVYRTYRGYSSAGVIIGV